MHLIRREGITPYAVMVIVGEADMLHRLFPGLRVTVVCTGIYAAGMPDNAI